MKKILLFIIIFSATMSYAQESGFVYDDHSRRDPFWRLISPNGVVMTYETDLMISDMILEGIIFDPKGRSLAIINGKVVAVGDRIGFFILTEIYEDKIILMKGGKKFILKMKKEE